MLLASLSTNSLPSVFNKACADGREVDVNTSSTPSTPSTPYQLAALSPFEFAANSNDKANPPVTLSSQHSTTKAEKIPHNGSTSIANVKPNPKPKFAIKSRNLHVDNLPPITENQLREFFSQFGAVLRVRIATHSITYTDADYGFVMFEKHEDAKRALVESDGATMPVSLCINPEEEHLFRDKKLRVTIARPKRKFLDLRANTNLYVANLPLTFSHTQLMDLFSKFGNILESRILMDRETGESRGVGFVRYENTNACNRAIQAYHNKIPSFGRVPLTVRYAVDKPPTSIPQQMIMNYTTPSTSYHPSINNLNAMTIQQSTFAAMMSPTTMPPLSPTNLMGAMDVNASITMMQYSTGMLPQNPYMQSLYLPPIPPPLSLSNLSLSDYSDFTTYSPSHHISPTLM